MKISDLASIITCLNTDNEDMDVLLFDDETQRTFDFTIERQDAEIAGFDELCPASLVIRRERGN